MTPTPHQRAREIWNSLERSRGVYHPNDKDAYINAIAQALVDERRRAIEDFASLMDEKARTLERCSRQSAFAAESHTLKVVSTSFAETASEIRALINDTSEEGTE